MSVSPVPKLARVPAGDVDIPGYPGLSLAPDLTTSTLTPVRTRRPGTSRSGMALRATRHVRYGRTGDEGQEQAMLPA